jgi:hypothetical protein
LTDDTLLNALARGRKDTEFWWKFFLNRQPHPGQLEFHENCNATINALVTANRWGKTTLLPAIHLKAQMYKEGAEARYLTADGKVDAQLFAKLRYRTIHTSENWQLASLVWDEALKLIQENPKLAAFIADTPHTLPPHIDTIFGGRWKFRTLGFDSRGIDGESYYLVSVDEAGWIEDLESQMGNVIRVRVADVRGRIIIVGTFKPGISRDFFKIAVRAAAHTGADIAFDHREELEAGLEVGSQIDPTIRHLCEKYGFPIDEYIDAATAAV